MRRLLIAGVLTALVPSISPAHELWLDRAEGGYILLQGHRDGADHGGSSTTACPIEWLKAAGWVDEEGRSGTISALDDYPIPTPPDFALLWVRLSSGTWTKSAGGTVNLPKNEVDHPLQSWTSFEEIKLVRHWRDHFAGPLDRGLEIVPLHDPLVLDAGDKLRVALFLDGEPVAGAVLLLNGKPRGKTDRAGRINVRIREKGIQTVVASLQKPVDSEETDEIVRTATLQFTARGER